MKKTVILIGVFLLGLLMGFQLDPMKINREMIQQASLLIGLKFTPQETDSMIEPLEKYREIYEAIRKDSFAYSTAPALVFDPRPKAYLTPRLQYPIQYSRPGKLRRPKSLDELSFWPVRELAELIKAREVSSLELTNLFLNRLKKYDPQLFCVVNLTEKYALERAKLLDKEIENGKYRGLLHGIPYGLKDLFAFKGYPTTWGASPFQMQQLDSNSAVAAKLEEAGAILIAKLSMGELARGDIWFGGRTRNPWENTLGSSGSSAGSASAVAAGLLPFAIGSETLGSIVSPATVCGVTGLRPTFGRISRYGAMPLAWSMDKVGPLCRQAEDCAIILQALAGTDLRDPSTIPAPFNYNHNFNVKTLRIGYIEDDFNKDYAFKANDEKTLKLLKESGLVLIPIRLPALPNLRLILNAEAAAVFNELTLKDMDDYLVQQNSSAWPNSFRTARFIPAVEYIQANRIRQELIEMMHQVMEKVDVYLAPTFSSNNLTLTNYTGHPALVIPNGFQDQKPTSITLTGSLFGEDKLLRLGKYIQDLTDHHKKYPERFDPRFNN